MIASISFCTLYWFSMLLKPLNRTHSKFLNYFCIHQSAVRSLRTVLPQPSSLHHEMKFRSLPFAPQAAFFLLSLELIGKLQDSHGGEMVLSTSLVLIVPDSLLNEKLLKYCLGQFLI